MAAIFHESIGLLTELVNLLIDISIKAGLLAAAAGAGLLVFRIRSSNVRHRVWTAVLLGMLLMPLLTRVTPGVRLPASMYPRLWISNVDVSASNVYKPRAAAPNALESAVSPGIPRPALPNSASPIDLTAAGANSAKDSSKDHAAGELPDAPIVAAIPDRADAIGRWVIAVAIAYLCGAGAMVARLLLALVRIRKLVRAARPVSLEPCHARLIGGTTVRESPTVRVPLTVGWFHPSILLPSDWKSWSDSLLVTVLTHEHAHIRRRDNWVTLAAAWNRAVYWFHPVAWFLSRRLSTLAEQVSDDAVIESLGDRAAYAKNLLAVAARLAGTPGRLHPASMAMAATPQVERRIDAILDAERPLARKLTAAGVLALTVIVTPLLLLTAGLRADDDQPPAAIAELPTPPKASAGAEHSRIGPDEIGGTCLDSNQAPLAHVKVSLYVIRHGDSSQTLVQETVTDSAGRFTFPKTPVLPSSNRGGDHYLVIARGAGHATAIRLARPGESNEIAMDKPETFRGLVKDPAGKPVSGALVSLNKTNPLDDYLLSPIEGVRSSKTNAKGEFIIDDVAEYQFVDREVVTRTARSEARYRLGPPWLWVQHPDFVRTHVSVSKVPGDANIVLAKGAILTGQVIHGNTEKPAVGITVELQGLDPQNGEARSFWTTNKTDSEGRYRLGPLPEGKFNVFIESGRDETAAAIDSIEVRGIQSVTAPSIRLVKGGVVKGRVTDDTTGKPVSLGKDEYLDVQVKGPSRPWSGAAVDVAEIKKDGTFEIRLPPGSNWLALRTVNPRETFETSGQAGGDVIVPDEGEVKVEYHVKRIPPARSQQSSRVTKPDANDPNAAVKLVAAAEPDAMAPDARKLEEGVVSGVVVKASDVSPVAGAHVILRSGGRTYSGTSGSDGRFRITKIPAESYGYEIGAYQANLVAPKTVVPQLPASKPEAAKFAPLRLEMTEGRQAKFVVTSKATGQPIAGAAVRFNYPDRRQATTAADGTAAVVGLLPQTYDVLITADRHAMAVQDIDLSRAESVPEFKFALDEGGTVQGRILDGDGKPVPKAPIDFRESGTGNSYYDYPSTDAEGRFRERFLPLNKPLEMNLRTKDYLEQSKAFVLTPDKRDLELTITLVKRPRGGSVAGTVTDAAGRPVARARIANYGHSSDPHATATTDAQGRFSLDDLVEGSGGYSLAVSAAGFAPQLVSVKPESAERPSNVSIKLEPGHKIHGRLDDEHGAPIQAAYVSVRSSAYPFGETGIGETIRTDKEGKFAFDSLPSDVRFDFHIPSHPRLRSIPLKLDGDEPITVKLEAPGIVRGLVVDAESGKPLPQFRVRVDRSDPGLMFKSGDGRFVVEPLETGKSVELAIEADGYQRAVANAVAAKADEAKEVKVSLVRIDRTELFTLSGKLLDYQDKPVAGAQLRLIVTPKQPTGTNDNQFNWELINSGQLAQRPNCDQFLSVVSDADGRFEFPNILAGKHLELAYWGEGVPRARSLAFGKTRPRKTDTVTIKLPQPATVRGTIRRASFPEAGSIKLAHSWDEEAFLDYDIQLGGDQSTFEFHDLAPGEYSAIVYAKPVPFIQNGTTFYQQSPLAGEKIQLKAGETKEVRFTEPDKKK